MKIALVDYILDPSKPGRSGLSDLVWDMASELVNQGHDAHIVASYQNDDYPDPRVMVHNFSTHRIEYRNIIGNLWLLKRAAHLVKRLNPDIVHSPEYVSTAVFHKMKVKAPLVFTVPGNIYHRLSVPDGSSFEWHYAQVLKWAANTAARHASAVIAISHEMKYWWERTGSDPAKTPMIPLGVDPRRFSFLSDAKQRLNFADNSTNLVFVGRFTREKGLRDLLSALSMLSSSERAGLSVILIGAGPLEQELRQGIEQSGLDRCVSLRSWVHPNELSTWYSAADALVLPSHTEGLSRTILEAMACGTPVIGTMISGTEDQIQHGLTGFLYPDYDVSALASILKKVSGKPEVLRNMRSDVYTYAQRNLIWERITERIVTEIYEPILQVRAQDSDEYRYARLPS